MTKTILIIDKHDEKNNQIRLVLERLGHFVMQTNTVKNSPKFIEALDIDLLIVNQNKFEKEENLIEQLKPSSKPVLVLSTLLYGFYKNESEGISNIKILKMPTLTENFIETIKGLLNKNN